MYSKTNHLTNLVRRLLTHFRQRGQQRLFRAVAQNAEWIRLAREAPTVAETMQWPAQDDFAHRARPARPRRLSCA
jgi:hypothetical protein